jgi:hypothetical protein
MNTEKIPRSATAEYWATVDRIGDGETVPTAEPPRRRLVWRLLALAPGGLLITAVIVWTLR